MSRLEELTTQAGAWMADDPDPATRAEVAALITEGDEAGLAERFAGLMEFGTAGLRGLLGAGPARMNRVTVARAAAGVARQILADVPDAATRGVVVGRDGRRLSPELSRITAEVIAGHGVNVHWFEDPVPTPVAAFAGRHLGAAATCIVTASHNPPEYNGFKVYSERGAQIVPPQDARIRAEMEGAGSAKDLPRVAFEAAIEAGTIQILEGTPDAAIDEAYLTALDAQCRGSVPPPAQVRVVTTALHGVGHRHIHTALRRRGFEDLHAVAEQAEPDGEFPTVRFPNPEEPGALDMALALGREVAAELIVANDPDVDRLCVAVAEPGAAGGFRVLTGNELGVLLADWLLGAPKLAGDRPFVCTTIVSTSMLAQVAAGYGARSDEVLTGFKWLWARGLELAAEGYRWVFGFEEALGYSVGPAVLDKDGIGAAEIAVELAAVLKANGQTLLDRLGELETRHGVHLTSQVSFVRPGLAGKEEIAGIMERLRAEPPGAIAGSAVARFRDLLDPGNPSGLPASNVLTWWLEDGSRVTLRPSGTEPKLKSYFESRVLVGVGGLAPAREAAKARVAELEAWARGVVTG